jgi:hypothetical protein
MRQLTAPIAIVSVLVALFLGWGWERSAARRRIAYVLAVVLGILWAASDGFPLVLPSFPGRTEIGDSIWSATRLVS